MSSSNGSWRCFEARSIHVGSSQAHVAQNHTGPLWTSVGVNPYNSSEHILLIILFTVRSSRGTCTNWSYSMIALTTQLIFQNSKQHSQIIFVLSLPRNFRSLHTVWMKCPEKITEINVSWQSVPIRPLAPRCFAILSRLH